MNLSPFKLLFASLALSAFAVAGCAADTTDTSGADDAAEDTDVTADELQSRARQFVGDFHWDAATSGDFVDFEKLTLDASGKYTASVDSGLVDARVVCVRFPCTLPEEGKWTTVKSGGKLKIKVDPTGPKGTRSYWAEIMPNGSLSLTRNGRTTILSKPTLSCANVRCAAGTHCEMRGINGGAIPVCLADQAPCVKTGCSGQICADTHRISTCEFRPEYACYRAATCERQADGACGWTRTPELNACLASH